MAETRITFDRASPGEIDAVLALLDQEFVSGRGRIGSFRKRFPALYTADRAGDITVARMADGIAGLAAVKWRTMVTGDRPVRLAMIGGVWIRPALRGRGVGQQLMKEVERSLSYSQTDLAVLWTGTPAFYEKTGWRSKDAGVFGQLVSELPGDSSQTTTVRLDGEGFRQVEKIRAAHVRPCIERTEADYNTVPSPAEFVECITVGPASNMASYALVGRGGGAAYVYEVAGDTSHFSALLAAAGQRATEVHINDHPSTALHAWLARHARVDWKPQQLAMWKVFSDWVHWEHVDGGPISLMDRI